MKKMKSSFKKFLSWKFYIYWWVLIICVLALAGAYSAGTFKGKTQENQVTHSYSMVKYLEEVNETVFLNVGIQKVETIKNDRDLFGWTIPYSEKQAIIILNYAAKFGIKEAVSVEELGENHFKVSIPEFKVVGVEVDDENPYQLYDESGGLLSYATDDVDTGEKVARLLSNDEQKNYLPAL